MRSRHYTPLAKLRYMQCCDAEALDTLRMQLQLATAEQRGWVRGCGACGWLASALPDPNTCPSALTCRLEHGRRRCCNVHFAAAGMRHCKHVQPPRP